VDPFDEDFREEADGMLSGASPSGELTIEAIRLNRAECVRFRLRRRRSAERIPRLREALLDLDESDPGRQLAEEALRYAEAEWEECYGRAPQVV
jgi:hypothetical protein